MFIQQCESSTYIDSDTILSAGDTSENKMRDHGCPCGGYTLVRGRRAIHMISKSIIVYIMLKMIIAMDKREDDRE